MKGYSIEELADISWQLRRDVIDILYKVKSGHPGGSLSIAEILTVLYFNIMNVDPKNPEMMERDRFILSKGHGAPMYYAALAMRGYFERSELFTLRQMGSMLQGHPDMKKTPGVDMSSGSLGQGLSVGCGMALVSKLEGLNNRVFVLLGDGELNEGQIWEAAMAASKFKLDNLIAVLDYNKVQLDGLTGDIMPMEPMVDKWRSFNWNTYDVCGHNLENLIKVFEMALQNKGKPTIIIAETIKGKGVSFMENRYEWHGNVLSSDDYEIACQDLNAQRRSRYGNKCSN